MVPENTAVSDRTRFKWQFNLRTILLFMAAVGVWTAEVVNRRAMPELEGRITAMQLLARELVIEDPSKIAIVKREELWYDDNEWDIYLPDDGFQLSLATRQVDEKHLAIPTKVVQLPPGRFRLGFLQEKVAGSWRLRLVKNGQEICSVEEPPEWNSGQGSSGGGHFAKAEQFNPTEPVVLFRRRFTRPTTGNSSQVPQGSCEGVLLRISPADKPEK